MSLALAGCFLWGDLIEEYLGFFTKQNPNPVHLRLSLRNKWVLPTYSAMSSLNQVQLHVWSSCFLKL